MKTANLAIGLTLLVLQPLAALAADNTAVKVDNSKRFYTRAAKDGSVVLGNGALEANDTTLAVQAPATVGDGTLDTANVRPGAAGVYAAINGSQPSTGYASRAVTDELKARDERLAVRVSQMFHRNSGLRGN